MDEIFKRILDTLKGVDFWIALFFLAAGIICWLWIGTTKRTEKKVLRRQIASGLILAVLAAGAMWANQFFLQREPVFSKSLIGILVIRIMDDDALNSAQGVLVEKLNVELQKDPAGKQIEVHAGGETVDEDSGLDAAHARARAIGQRLNATLVIWGRKIGDKKFYPRITVVNPPKAWTATSERTSDVQNIDELRLPEELVDEPFYLIHFAAGYSYYDQGNYKEALPHFEAALQRKGALINELADLQFFSAVCYYSLSAGQKEMTGKLQEAIGLFEKAAAVYEAANQRRWAQTQINLGAAYSSLPTGDRAANLQKAIAAYQAALRVRTEKDFPGDWAGTQTNLGAAYADLPTGDRAANLQKAIATHKTALRVFTEKDFPVDWALAQSNLGVALYRLGKLIGAEEGRKLLEDAAAAFRSALEVRTKADLPEDWAMTQIDLSDVVWALGIQSEGDERLKRRAESVELLREVVSFRPDDLSRYHLAMTLGSLGFQLVLDNQFAEAQKRCEEAQSLADSIGDGMNKTDRDDLIFIQAILAHALLFQGHYDEALAIYNKYWNKPLHGETFGEVTMKDFTAFDKAGLINPDLSRVKEVLGNLHGKAPSQ